MLLDPGLLFTGVAVAIAVIGNPHNKWLRNLLFLLWAIAVLQDIGGSTMSARVGVRATFDLAIAVTSLVIATDDPSRRDARVVGLVSMALMPSHWIMSITQGAPDWTLYAIVCNLAFGLQCLVIRGWLDGLGRTISRFYSRLTHVSISRIWRQ